MYVIEDQMKDLQKEMEKYEAEIAAAQQTLEDAQRKMGAVNRHRTEVAARIAALKSEADELQTSRSLIGGERKAAEGEINDAKKVIDDMTAHLEKKAPKDRPKAIVDTIKSVDNEVGEKKKAVDELRAKVSEAEKTLADAQGQSSHYEKAAGENKALLKGLPNQIKMANGRVSTLKKNVTTAAKNGPTTEALYLLEQLKQAVEELGKLVDPRREEELINQQLDHQQKAAAAKADVAKKAAECDRLRHDLTAAERDYQAKAKWRETAIKTKLAALPEGEAQPETEETGTPAPSGAGNSSAEAGQGDTSASGGAEKPRNP